MNQAVIASFVRKFMTALGAFLISAGFINTEHPFFGSDSIDALAGLIGLIVLGVSSFLSYLKHRQKDEDGYFGTGTRINSLILFLCLLPALVALPGCETAQRIWESPTVKKVVNISLSAIAAKQARDNPEYAWAIEGLATYLQGIDTARPPDAFSQALETWILSNVSDPTMRERLKGEIAETANSAYAELYAEYGDTLSDTQLVEIIKAMGLAIEDGTKPPSVDAGERAYVVETATLRVEIR